MTCGKKNKNKGQYIVQPIIMESGLCIKNMDCTDKKDCKKNDNCSKCCNCCEKCCECCCHQDMREIYDYLGKYVYNILKELQLPCDHPSLICSLQKLADGKCLPCGHPSLEQLIMMAIIQEKPEKKCDNNHWCKYKN